MTKSIALIGDYREQVIAHLAIPKVLELANDALNANIKWEWLGTDAIGENAPDQLAEYAAIWAVPGSPYVSTKGALLAIQFAREWEIPFLGTCGGFQHGLLEYARSVCGVKDADHAETNPDSTSLIITPLSCSLVEKSGQIDFMPGSRLHNIYEGESTTEGYHCSFGLNPEWEDRLRSAGLHFTGFDGDRQIRAFELPSHPFFIGTLFQPERAALRGQLHPLIKAFVTAAVAIKS
jgi:CTP synthase (UTP-ammonia lyase)